MIRVVAIISICFFATVCFAQEQYQNSDWNFSFRRRRLREQIRDGEIRVREKRNVDRYQPLQIRRVSDSGGASA